jgi:DnaK suppressor protein
MKKIETDARGIRLHAMLTRIIVDSQQELKGIRDGMRQGGTDRRAVGDVVDDITREADIASIAARSTALTSRLSAAQEALRRLETDTGYGICNHCGTEIPEARLLALPFAQRCIICQEAAEGTATLSRRQTGAHYTP